MGRLAALTAVLTAVAVTLAGCGGDAPSPLADGCTGDPGVIERALRAAPEPVLLEDGTSLAQCIADGTDDAELQAVGLAYSAVAERLAVRARSDVAAATQLGYLVGATRRGAARTEGVMSELVRRVELRAGRTMEDIAPASAKAIEAGIAAGQATG